MLNLPEMVRNAKEKHQPPLVEFILQDVFFFNFICCVLVNSGRIPKAMEGINRFDLSLGISYVDVHIFGKFFE